MRSPFGIVLLIAPALASATEWCGVEGSSLAFETTFEGEALPGTFGRFDVVFDFDPGRPADADLRVTVDLLAGDMGDEDMNEVLFDVAWLHVGKYPEAVYTSDTILEQAPDSYIAEGALRLKGAERRVSVPFSFRNSDERAEMSGEVVLRRTDFDVGSGEWSTGDSIGLDVRLRFDVKLEPCAESP